MMSKSDSDDRLREERLLSMIRNSADPAKAMEIAFTIILASEASFQSNREEQIASRLEFDETA